MKVVAQVHHLVAPSDDASLVQNKGESGLIDLDVVDPLAVDGLSSSSIALRGGTVLPRATVNYGSNP